MTDWLRSIFQNLIANALWVIGAAAFAVLAVWLASLTPIITLFAPLSYLLAALVVLLGVSLIAYLSARAWRHLNPLSAQSADPMLAEELARIGERLNRAEERLNGAKVVEAVGTAGGNSAPADDREKLLGSLNRARDNARVTIHQGNAPQYERAFNEIEAVMLSIKQRFGISLMKQAAGITETQGRKAALQAYVRYIDTFYPMLREGHSDAAKAKAAAFKWPA